MQCLTLTKRLLFALIFLVGSHTDLIGQPNANLVAGLKAYYSSENDAALKYFKAAGNDPDALVMLARMYYRGDGMTADYLTAKTYAESAIASGNAMGNLILSFIYENGSASIPKNTTLAQSYLQRALPAINQVRRLIIQQIERVYEVEVIDSNSLRMPELEERFIGYGSIRIFNTKHLIWTNGISIAAEDDNILLNAAYIHMYAYLLDTKQIPADKVFTARSLYYLAHQIGYVQSTIAVANIYAANQMYNYAANFYGQAYQRNHIQSFISMVNNLKQNSWDSYKVLDTLIHEIRKKNQILPDCIGMLVEQMMNDRRNFDSRFIYEWAMVGYKEKSTNSAYYLGNMYENGYYVFQDIDKAIRYYEDAGKFSANSYGPLEAARLKILMKKPDSTAAWQLIRNAAAKGNVRAKLYDINPSLPSVSFNANGLSGTIARKVDFLYYSPIPIENDIQYLMQFDINYQNNSGTNIQIWPGKVWNIPYESYASSSPKGAGMQTHQTYIVPEQAGSYFGNLPINFRTRGTNNEYRTVTTVQMPVAALLLPKRYDNNLLLNAPREKQVETLKLDDLLNITSRRKQEASADFANSLNGKTADQMVNYDIANWMNIRLPGNLAMSEYEPYHFNQERNIFDYQNGQHKLTIFKLTPGELVAYGNEFSRIPDKDDSLKMIIQKMLLSDNSVKLLQPYIQIKEVLSGTTEKGNAYHQVSTFIRYNNKDYINEYDYHNFGFFQSASAYYVVILTKSSRPKNGTGSNTLTAIEEKSLHERAKSIFKNIELYE